MQIDFDTIEIGALANKLENMGQAMLIRADECNGAVKTLYEQGHRDVHYFQIKADVDDQVVKIVKYAQSLDVFYQHLNNLIRNIQAYLNYYGKPAEVHAKLNYQLLVETLQCIDAFISTCNSEINEFENSINRRKSKAEDKIARLRSEVERAQKNVDYAQRDLDRESQALSSCERQPPTIEYEENEEGIEVPIEEPPNCTHEKASVESAASFLRSQVKLLEPIQAKYDSTCHIYDEFKDAYQHYLLKLDALRSFLNHLAEAQSELEAIQYSLLPFINTHIIVKKSKELGDYTMGEIDKMNQPRPGKDFTPKQKGFKKAMSRHYNNGRLIDETDYTVLEEAKKHQKGVVPPDNEAQFDHSHPKSKGGSGSLDNMDTMGRKKNIAKSNK